MTDRELHKLGRRDLLQLMLESAREAEKSRNQLKETENQLAALKKNYERLRKRLDDKDAQIHNLKDKLQAVRKQREIQLEEAGSIAEASLRLNGVFEAAQKAAEQYLYNIKIKAQMEECSRQKGVREQGEEQEKRQEGAGDSVLGADRDGAAEGTP